MNITASEVMTTQVTTAHRDMTVEELIRVVKAKSFSGLPVVDAEGRAVGLVSQNDVLRALAHFQSGEDFLASFTAGGDARRKASAALLADALNQGRAIAVANLLKRPVSDIMSAEVISCSADTDVSEVCQMMLARRIHRVVVLDDQQRVTGLISATDLVRKLGAILAAG